MLRYIPYRHIHTLPKLPVPTLAASCQNYYRAVLPLLNTPQEVAQTKKAVEAFESQANTLQQKLMEMDRVEDDYMEDRGYNRASFLERAWDDGNRLVYGVVVVNISL